MRKSLAKQYPRSPKKLALVSAKQLAALLIAAVIGFTSQVVCAKTALSLADVIQLALRHSGLVKAAEHDSSAAFYHYREAKSARFPTLSLQATSFYKDELQSIDIPPRSIEIGTHENYQADVRLTLPLFTGGRISNRINVQRANVRTQYLNLEAERLRSAYMSRKAYFNLLTALAVEKSAEASLKRVKVIETDVQNLFASGMADSVDLLDASLAVQEATQILQAKRTARRNASSALERLIGFSADEALELIETVPVPKKPLTADTELTLREIERPEIAMFESQVKAAELMVSLSKANYLPILSGYGSYSLGKPNQDLFNKEWNDYFSVGVYFQWDFNTGGSVASSVNAARQEELSVKMTKKDLEESLLLHARVSVDNLDYAYDVFKISKSKYEIAKHKFRLAKKKHKAGHMSVNRLLELEAELASVEKLYAASQNSYYIAETEFFYATGSRKIFGGL